MKIEDTATAADNSGAFTIAATGKAFKILSDGLYSDKIKAIIRELSCNARDSHVAAGNADPFLVHLPSNDQPYFAVEDHGVGLSEEDVLNIYTRYFASTKTTSNDFVGQLGLGSKSPFSYTNQFTVVSKHAGTQTTYEMSIDGSGTPRAAKLFSGPCQGSGITVSFTVTRDYQRWHDKAMEVLQWFTQKPIITDGVVQFDPVQNAEPRYQGAGWRMWSKPFWNGSTVQILMGGVLYPLDKHSLPDLDHRIGYICEFPMVIDMPIGDCDVAASREGLSYDARTISNIVSRLTAVRADMVANITAAIANAPTLWAAHNQWQAHFQGSLGYNMRRVFDDVALTWQGQNIDRGHITVEAAKLYGTVDHGVRLLPREIKSVRVHDSFTLPCTEHTKVVFDDLKKGGLARTRQMHAAAGHAYTVAMFPYRGGWDVLRDELGNPEVIYTSTLPEVAKKTKNTVQQVWSLSAHNRNGGKWAWKEVDPATLPAKGQLIYVTLKNWDVTTGNKYLGRYGLDMLRSAAVQVGLLKQDTVIYAVRPISVRKLDAKRWVGLHEHLEPLAKNMLAEPKIQVLYRAHSEQSQVQDVIPHTINKLSAMVERLRSMVREPESELVGFLDNLSNMKAASNVDLTPYRTLQRHYDISMPEFDERSAVGIEAERITRKYAMLKYVNLGYHIDQKSMDDLVNYIDAVDTAHMFLSLSKSDAETDV